MTTPTPPRHRPRDRVRSTMESRLQRAITGRHALPVPGRGHRRAGDRRGLPDDRDRSPGLPQRGDGLWWSIQTLSTVGYGDIVPTSTWGRLLGSVVIIVGATFLAFLTASVTSMFIASEQERRAEAKQEEDAA